MAEVLKEWLSERLQRPLKWEAEEFGPMMRNGHVISSILLSYHVINDEKHYLIRPNDTIDDINNNWHYLLEWLRDVEINISDTDLNNIKDGKGSTILRLFYQLFLHLDKRDRINFLKKERKMVSNLVDKIDHRFKIDKVDDDISVQIDDLSKPLLNEKQFIEWQKKKSAEVKATYDFIRHKYLKTCARIEESQTPIQEKLIKAQEKTSKIKKDIKLFSEKYPCKFAKLAYEDLLNLEEKANENKVRVVDTEWTKQYMDNLHTKLHKKSDSVEFQNQVRNAITTSLWDLSVTEEETKLDTELAKKVMKLSYFEKQMCTQLMETKQQAFNLIKNRIDAGKEFEDEREQQFNQYLDHIKEQIHLEVAEIDFERERQNMLHKRLYAEKMKRKRQHYYEICYETMLSIVDYATKYAHFKTLIGDDIPEHFIREWKALYYKRQPVFDILNEMEKLIQEHNAEEEIDEEEELIVRLELDRQECLNENDFNEFHNYLGLWRLDTLLPNYDPDTEERKYEYLGLNILGHIVYTLLEIKYPYPVGRLPAELPNYMSKALLVGLPDRSITIPMQALLDFRKIHVVRIETAINYCLNSYKVEMIGSKDIDISFDKFINEACENDKELLKLMKTEEDAKNIDVINVPNPPNAKQTQTPKTLPEEDMVLSAPAELGKYAYECLYSGDSMTDYLIAAIIVEYLKNQKDINGFVIINYPNCYREAQILEETFAGRAPPDEDNLDDRDDIYLEKSIENHRKKEKDPYKDIRISRLVNDPHKKGEDKPFMSYFTSYIKLKQTEDILQELVVWELTDDNSEFIDRFYSCLGINYSMYYEIIEKDFLAQICKYIIGDFDLPLKSLDNLFGERVLSMLEFPSSEDKRQKSKIVKPEIKTSKSKEKLKRSSKRKQGIDSMTDQMKPDVSIISEPLESMLVFNALEEEDIKSKKSIDTIEEVILLPGEENWIYGELPITESIGISLASLWEQIEKTYIHDIEQLFFAKRLQMNSLVPYTRFIRDKMDQIITLPSNKQDLVIKFQTEYNNFEDDWRNIHVSKNEWHCRVKELKNRLYNICDERKLHGERQRQSLIAENWAMEELTSMVNTYICCMQTEINRYVLTIQIMHDFYFTMLKRLPTSDRLSSKDLVKLVREIEDIPGVKKSAEDKVYKQLKNAFQDMQLKNILIDFSNNPFNLIIENNYKLGLKIIKDIYDSYRTIINRENGEISKMCTNTKSKKDETGSKDTILSEEVYKINALKCIDEWSMAINGEMCRANLCLQVIQYKCYRDMKLFNDQIYKTFTEIQNYINDHYINEIKSVDRLCKYLQMAIEHGSKIEESLLLEHDTFVIDPNLLVFGPPVSHKVAELEEIVSDYDFKIGKLAKLRSHLKLVAPNGLSMQKAFIYLLQDFVFYSREECDGPLVPEFWKNLDPEDVPKLVLNIFGETVYIDWRDFLIYCLNIRFPNIDELFDLRKQMRSIDQDITERITRDNFLKLYLWYENDFDYNNVQTELRLNLTRHFLFELFETCKDEMNYSAFLLAFCKDLDPTSGFVSALSMAVGKKICYLAEECDDTVQKLIELREYRVQCNACAHKCAEKFLDTMLNTVIRTCEGTIITELEFSEPPESDKKKKGKGGSGKSKSAIKPEVSQSAREPKTKNALSKIKIVTQSAIDVNTESCKICLEEPEVDEDKKGNKEEEPESVRISLTPNVDPNLVYDVSQDVIWNVLKICLPWHFDLLPDQKTTPYIDEMRELIKKLETDTDNGYIYVCKLVKEQFVCELLHKTKKFHAINLGDVVRRFLH